MKEKNHQGTEISKKRIQKPFNFVSEMKKVNNSDN